MLAIFNGSNSKITSYIQKTIEYKQSIALFKNAFLQNFIRKMVWLKNR